MKKTKPNPPTTKPGTNVLPPGGQTQPKNPKQPNVPIKYDPPLTATPGKKLPTPQTTAKIADKQPPQKQLPTADPAPAPRKPWNGDYQIQYLANYQLYKDFDTGDIRRYMYHYPDGSFAVVRQMFRVKPRKASQHSFQRTISGESYLLESKKISNDQELIQSDPI